jgi:hypothetical protein
MQSKLCDKAPWTNGTKDLYSTNIISCHTKRYSFTPVHRLGLRSKDIGHTKLSTSKQFSSTQSKRYGRNNAALQ